MNDGSLTLGIAEAAPPRDALLVQAEIVDAYNKWARLGHEYDVVAAALEGNDDPVSKVIGPEVYVPIGHEEVTTVKIAITPEMHRSLLEQFANDLARQYAETTNKLAELYIELGGMLH